MKSLKRNYYSSEFKGIVKRHYMYSSDDYTDISKKFNVNINTVSFWCRDLNRVHSTPDFNMGMVLEELIGLTHNFNPDRWDIEFVKESVDRYYGIGENDFYGLKSKV